MSDLPGQHDVFQAVADSTRREIIRILADEELPITAIVGHFPITRTAINKHLHILTDAGLLSSRRVGRETRYKLLPDPLFQLQQWVSFYEVYWEDHLQVLRSYVESDNNGPGK